MSEFWTDLQRILLLGTDRAALSDRLRRSMAEYQIPERGTEAEQLLRSLSYFHQLRKGAALPARKSKLPQGPEPDELAVPNHRQALIARHLLRNEDLLPILPEYIELLAQQGLSLPPEAIPAAFSYYLDHPTQLPVLQKVLGNRAIWLARQNPEWALFAPLNAEESWLYGTLEERKIYLQQLREKDPELGLEKLESAWSDLPSGFHLPLLKALQEKLTTADAPFLQQLLAHPEPSIRRLAGRGLCQIPGASYLEKLTALARKLFQKTEAGSYRPIEAADFPALRDQAADLGLLGPGGDIKREILSISRDIVGILPPRSWEKLWQTSAAGALEIFRAGPRYQLIRNDLAGSIRHYGDIPWMKDLLRPMLEMAAEQWDHPALCKLIMELPYNVFTGLADEYLSFAKSLLEPTSLIYFMLLESPHPWTPGISRRLMGIFQDYLQYSRAHFQDEAAHYEPLLRVLALRSDPALMTEFQVGWPEGSFLWYRWEAVVQKMLRILDLRKKMHLAFREKP